MEKPDFEFSESDFDVCGNSDPVIDSRLLWAFGQDEVTGSVTVIPMNGDRIIIHGQQEAEIFCNILAGCFQ